MRFFRKNSKIKDDDNISTEEKSLYEIIYNEMGADTKSLSFRFDNTIIKVYVEGKYVINVVNENKKFSFADRLSYSINEIDDKHLLQMKRKIPENIHDQYHYNRILLSFPSLNNFINSIYSIEAVKAFNFLTKNFNHNKITIQQEVNVPRIIRKDLSNFIKESTLENNKTEELFNKLNEIGFFFYWNGGNNEIIKDSVSNFVYKSSKQSTLIQNVFNNTGFVISDILNKILEYYSDGKISISKDDILIKGEKEVVYENKNKVASMSLKINEDSVSSMSVERIKNENNTLEFEMIKNMRSLKEVNERYKKDSTLLKEARKSTTKDALQKTLDKSLKKIGALEEDRYRINIRRSNLLREWISRISGDEEKEKEKQIVERKLKAINFVKNNVFVPNDADLEEEKNISESIRTGNFVEDTQKEDLESDKNTGKRDFDLPDISSLLLDNTDQSESEEQKNPDVSKKAFGGTSLPVLQNSKKQSFLSKESFDTIGTLLKENNNTTDKVLHINNIIPNFKSINTHSLENENYKETSILKDRISLPDLSLLEENSEKTPGNKKENIVEKKVNSDNSDGLLNNVDNNKDLEEEFSEFSYDDGEESNDFENISQREESTDTEALNKIHKDLSTIETEEIVENESGLPSSDDLNLDNDLTNVDSNSENKRSDNVVETEKIIMPDYDEEEELDDTPEDDGLDEETRRILEEENERFNSIKESSSIDSDEEEEVEGENESEETDVDDDNEEENVKDPIEETIIKNAPREIVKYAPETPEDAPEQDENDTSNDDAINVETDVKSDSEEKDTKEETSAPIEFKENLFGDDEDDSEEASFNDTNYTEQPVPPGSVDLRDIDLFAKIVKKKKEAKKFRKFVKKNTQSSNAFASKDLTIDLNDDTPLEEKLRGVPDDEVIKMVFKNEKNTDSDDFSDSAFDI